MPGVALPGTGFEEYAGSYVALAAVWDVYGAVVLDDTPGDPHSGSWCARFDQSTPNAALVYPKGGYAGTGRLETVFDATFWIAHDSPTNLGGPQAPDYASERAIMRFPPGGGVQYADPYVALSDAGGNIGVTGWATDRYRTPPGTLPGDGAWRQVHLHIEFDRNGTHAAGAGVVQIWIDGVLQLDEHAAELAVWHAAVGDPDATYEGTYGAVELTGDNTAFGYTYWRLDDIGATAHQRARAYLLA